MQSRQLRTFGVCVLLLAGAAVAQARSFDVNLSLSIQHDTNLFNGDQDSDRLDDQALEGSVFLVKTLALGPLTTFSLEPGVTGVLRRETRELSEIRPEMGVSLRHRFGEDFSAPFLDVSASVALRQFEDSEIRDSSEFEARAMLGMRVGESATVRGGYRFTRRNSFEQDVWDTSMHRLFAQVDVDVSADLVIYGGASAGRGDVVSVRPVAGPVRPWANAVSPTTDPATEFGGIRRWLYRLDATLYEAELGGNYLLGRGLALDLLARYRHAEGRRDNDYDGWNVGLAVLWSVP